MTTTSPRTASGKPQRIEPLVAVDSPAAWVGTQMKHSDTWIYQLSEVELAELDAALRQTQGRGLGINEIGKGDFPLPTLGARLAEIQDEILNGRGFVLIRGIPVERYSIAEAATVYWGIGSHIGIAIRATASDPVRLTLPFEHAPAGHDEEEERGKRQALTQELFRKTEAVFRRRRDDERRHEEEKPQTENSETIGVRRRGAAQHLSSFTLHASFILHEGTTFPAGAR